MKISQKGLYALQAMMMLARHHNQGAIRIRDIAYEEELPEKFLELILLELKNARMVESARGAKGGYQLRRSPSDVDQLGARFAGPDRPKLVQERLELIDSPSATHSSVRSATTFAPRPSLPRSSAAPRIRPSSRP